MLLHHRTPQRRRTAATYVGTVQQIVPRIRPIDVGLFAGKLRYRNLPLLERITFFAMSRLPSGDFRDWDAIRAWALHVRPALMQGIHA
jgi:menaquinone-dependent protoporphyrinogen oxidase